MARIVLGLGTSHSPHVSTVAELWHLHAKRDRRNPNLDFDALVAAAPSGLEHELTPAVFQAKHDKCQQAIDGLSLALSQAAVDVVVVVGDDQRELFLDECSPAFAVYTGPMLVDIPPSMAHADPSHVPAMWARHSAQLESYPGMPALANSIVAGLCGEDFDVAVASTQFENRSLGHAFTFVRLRLMKDRVVPIIPIFINCYFPPNQPSAARCFAFGEALRRAIEAAPGEQRVALVASGGLTHFVIDEHVDGQVLRGIAEKRSDLLRSLDASTLTSGSSEIRNWIAVAGALQDFEVPLMEYVPAYRSPAGTGCGMAFVRWEATSAAQTATLG